MSLGWCCVFLTDSALDNHAKKFGGRIHPTRNSRGSTKGLMTTTKPNPGWMAEYADRRLNNITQEMLNQEIQDLTSLGGRLALELECLLLECEDTAAVSKWWNSAQAALEDWRSHLWSVSHGPAGELTANQMANAKADGRAA